MGIVLEVRFWVKYPSDILATNTRVASAIHKLYSDKLIYMPFIKGIELSQDHTIESRQAGSQQFEQELDNIQAVKKDHVEGFTPEQMEDIESAYDAE